MMLVFTHGLGWLPRARAAVVDGVRGGCMPRDGTARRVRQAVHRARRTVEGVLVRWRSRAGFHVRTRIRGPTRAFLRRAVQEGLAREGRLRPVALLMATPTCRSAGPALCWRSTTER